MRNVIALNEFFFQKSHFRFRCVEMNVVILSRAFGSQLRIADFENFRNEVHEIFEECRGFTGGKVLNTFLLILFVSKRFLMDVFFRMLPTFHN